MDGARTQEWGHCVSQGPSVLGPTSPRGPPAQRLAPPRGPAKHKKKPRDPPQGQSAWPTDKSELKRRDLGPLSHPYTCLLGCTAGLQRPLGAGGQQGTGQEAAGPGPRGPPPGLGPASAPGTWAGWVGQCLGPVCVWGPSCRPPVCRLCPGNRPQGALVPLGHLLGLQKRKQPRPHSVGHSAQTAAVAVESPCHQPRAVPAGGPRLETVPGRQERPASRGGRRQGPGIRCTSSATPGAPPACGSPRAGLAERLRPQEAWGPACLPQDDGGSRALGGGDWGVSLTFSFLTCRGRSAHPAPEGKMAPKAPRVVGVRTVTLVLWDPLGRKYVTQGARPLPGDRRFPMATAIQTGDLIWLSPPRWGRCGSSYSGQTPLPHTSEFAC